MPTPNDSCSMDNRDGFVEIFSVAASFIVNYVVLNLYNNTYKSGGVLERGTVRECPKGEHEIRLDVSPLRTEFTIIWQNMTNLSYSGGFGLDEG